MIPDQRPLNGCACVFYLLTRSHYITDSVCCLRWSLFCYQLLSLYASRKRTCYCSATNPFNGPLSRTTRVSRYQKGKTNLEFTEARDSEWQWHQLGHMQVCTLLQTDNHTSTPPLVFTGQMPFLLPNQQRQSTVNVTMWRNDSIMCLAMLTNKKMKTHT